VPSRTKVSTSQLPPTPPMPPSPTGWRAPARGALTAPCTITTGVEHAETRAASKIDAASLQYRPAADVSATARLANHYFEDRPTRRGPQNNSAVNSSIAEKS